MWRATKSDCFITKIQKANGAQRREKWSQPDMRAKKAESILLQFHQATKAEGTTYIDLSSIN